MGNWRCVFVQTPFVFEDLSILKFMCDDMKRQKTRTQSDSEQGEDSDTPGTFGFESSTEKGDEEEE